MPSDPDTEWPGDVGRHRKALGRHGWSEREGVADRHEALQRSAITDGYEATEHRLGALRDVVDRRSERLNAVAKADLSWMKREHKRGDI